MDADAGHLQKFTDVPYVIEAPASKSRAAAAAAQAFAGARVTFDDSRPLTDERYRGLVQSVRAQIVEDLKPRADWRIEIVDRTAKDIIKEGQRIDRTLGGFMRSLGGPRDPGAMAQPFPADTLKVKGCAVIGFPVGTDVAEVFSAPVMGAPVPLQGITNEKFQRVALWHELGHCLLGASEVRADTFAALMSIRHGVYGQEALSTLASWRETTEWTNPRLDDDHFIAASLWEVAARADALRENPRFMAMGMEEIAGLAKSMADRYGLDRKGVEDAMTMRAALFAAASREVHYVKGPDGKAHKADIHEWAAAHALDLPEIRRMDAVTENLVSGARPMASFAIDLKSFRARVAALAKGGDPTSKAMLASLERSARAHRADEPDFAEVIPYGIKGSAFAQQAFSMTATAKLSPSLRPSTQGVPAPAAIPASLETEEPPVPGMGR